MATPQPSAATLAAAHILAQLARHRAALSASSEPARPLFVAVQGPQGSGKTHLARLLHAHLAAPPHSARLAVLSLDDLYLPHAALQRVAAAHPANRLLAGRGQPGTHDVALGVRVLQGLREINARAGGAEELPAFDKSLHSGQGDRVPGAMVQGPLDVVVLEGWCTGFYPIGEREIERRWQDYYGRSAAPICTVQDIKQINTELKAYLQLWNLFEVFIQLKPQPPTDPGLSPFTNIYKWRLQQEHAMKAANGGRGMNDDEVVAFVDRYIPGYVFFSDGILRGSESPGSDILPQTASDTGTDNSSEVTQGKCESRPPWIGKSLVITIGENREVLASHDF